MDTSTNFPPNQTVHAQKSHYLHLDNQSDHAKSEFAINSNDVESSSLQNGFSNIGTTVPTSCVCLTQNLSNFHYLKKFDRIFQKNGNSNILVGSGKRLKSFAYIFDIYTTLINLSWWKITLFVIIIYMLSYLVFGLLWRLASLVPNPDDPTGCVVGVNSTLSAILLSLEVQSTIGFGTRHPADESECFLDVVILFIQVTYSLILDAFSLALLVTRISRPYRRKATILFSNNATIFRNDNGSWYFSIRVADLRSAKLVEPHVKLLLFNVLGCSDTQDIKYQISDMDVGYDQGIDRLHLLLPSEIRHEITATSPLYHISPLTLVNKGYEIIVILEGIVEGTGLTTQVRTSYKGAEIKFGKQFVGILSRKDSRIYINLNAFHEMIDKHDCDLTKSFYELDTAAK